ncbi:MAG: right-handed parallel beta-helix repeat-containing protein, partial [Armatimonadetes bacterium]|nr:right-handed parallel beta-helix repeat-containing protein [Armatimonadota bacterium]
GGKVVRGLQRERDNLYSTVIPETKGHAWVFRQLWVNGRRRTLARSPNTGYFTIAGKAAPGVGPDGKEVDRTHTAVRFRPGDVKNWPNLSDIDLFLFQIWETEVFPLKSVDEATGTLEVTGSTKWPFAWAGADQRYWIENHPGALDAPGEWQLDRETGKLSILAMPGEDLSKAEVVAPAAAQLVLLQGDAAAGQWVEHLTFEGLAFEHTDWPLPPEGHGDWQSAVTVNAAIQANGARECALVGCEVAHTGGYGIWFESGCQGDRVERCELRDLGAGGVRIGQAGIPAPALATGGCTVHNNFIHDGGHLHCGAIGVWVGQSSDNRITHNEICDLRYTGISVGWSWGFNPTTCHNNLIADNHLHHLGLEVLSDMGAIYTLGISTGTVVRHNLIHHVVGYQRSGSAGIYPDEGSSGILYEDNVAYQTVSGGFSIHYGRGLIARNNIFAFGRDYTVSRGRLDQTSDSTLEHNVFLTASDTLFVGNAKLTADHNLYWRTTGEPAFQDDMTFAEWQAKGYDEHSIVADPLFRDPEHGDFRLKPGSPVDKIGFKPIDTSTCGLEGPKAWTDRPKQVKRPPLEVGERPIPPAQTINEGFENAAVGVTADNCVTWGETPTATIRVTEETAATGKRSLKFTDQPNLDFSFNPHLWYTPNQTKDVWRFSCDLRVEAGAQVWIEWRDASTPYKVGPSFSVSAAGELTVGGKSLAQMPVGEWFHVEVVCGLGKQSTATWDFSYTLPGAAPVKVEKLPCDPKFTKLQWLGIVSGANDQRVFYVDNVKLEKVGP